MNHSKIEEQVMAGVGLVYAARVLTSATALKLYVLTFSFLGVITLVSVSNVLANLALVAEGGAANLVGYLVAAALGTTLVVQLALVAGVAAFVSLLAPFVRLTRGRLLA